jgi:hypothetical protein
LFLCNRKVREVKHKLIEFDEDKIFAGQTLFYRGLKDHHHFIIKPISKYKCTFIQSDQAKGFMSIFMESYITNNRLNGYIDFNSKLKYSCANKRHHKYGIKRAISTQKKH